MPSNKELIADIEQLAGEMGVPVDTGKLNSKKLTALLSDLRAAEAAPAEAAPAEAAPAEAAPATRYYLRAGKSITSKRGILADGDEVKPDFLAGGSDTISLLLASGHVVQR